MSFKLKLTNCQYQHSIHYLQKSKLISGVAVCSSVVKSMATCTSAHQREAVSVTLCCQSGLKLSVVTDRVWVELDRSNFDQVDVGLCQRCDRVGEMLHFDWQIVSLAVLLFVVSFSVLVYVCMWASVHVAPFVWLLMCLNLPFFQISSWSALLFPTISLVKITSTIYYHVRGCWSERCGWPW